jgi:hypothetical protein
MWQRGSVNQKVHPFANFIKFITENNSDQPIFRFAYIHPVSSTLSKIPVINSVNSTPPILSSKFTSKILSRYIPVYAFLPFRSSRQLGCNSGNHVKSRLTAATSTPRTQHEVFRLFHTFLKIQ